MAQQILSTSTPLQTEQRKYSLPEAHRQAMLAQSNLFKQRTEIEQKRQRFIALNGSPFGTEEPLHNKDSK